MSCHRVALAPDSAAMLRARFDFHGVRRAYGEVDDPRRVSLDEAHVDCRLGMAPRDGRVCARCPRLVSWEPGPTPREVTVRCRYDGADPVSARMTGADALVSVGPGARCVEADRVAAREFVHRLLVVDHGFLVGIVCRHDLAGAPSDRVAAHMRREVYVVDATATLGEAAAAMWALDVGCLPVTRDHRLVGVLTRGDLVRAGLPETIFTRPPRS